MIIKDLFKKPIDRSIQGVVTIGNEDEEQKWMELEEPSNSEYSSENIEIP